MSSYTVSLVLPFYNEEDGVVEVVTNLLSELKRECFNFQLVLVNNGSTDQTASLLISLAQGNPEILVKHVPLNQGYGWGIISGLQAARGDLIGFLCGDGQTAPQDVSKVLRKAFLHPDKLVKARRSRRSDGVIRKINSLIYNILFRLLFGVNTFDVNGTPKIFSRKIWESMHLISKDWFIDAELIIKAKRNDLDLLEVPIAYRPRVGGRSKVSVRAAWEFLQNMWKYRFGAFA